MSWGTSKEFTSEQLAKGINLAAEFVQGNPFHNQFNAVNGVVAIQENQETVLSKVFMLSIADWKIDFAPGVDALWPQIVDAAMKRHEALMQIAKGLVTPVTHTIKIEPEA